MAQTQVKVVGPDRLTLARFMLRSFARCLEGRTTGAAIVDGATAPAPVGVHTIYVNHIPMLMLCHTSGKIDLPTLNFTLSPEDADLCERSGKAVSRNRAIIDHPIMVSYRPYPDPNSRY